MVAPPASAAPASTPTWSASGNAGLEPIVLPATIGEIWILGYLIVVGVRMPRAATASAPAMTAT